MVAVGPCARIKTPPGAEHLNVERGSTSAKRRDKKDYEVENGIRNTDITLYR
jgi:hypothetical protein